MTEYDFKSRPNRLAQHSIKWKASEEDPELLQLWIADMDFEPLPELRQAIIDYGENHIFGYSYPSDDLYKAIINWEEQNHHYAVKQDDIVLIEGVVPALSIAIQSYTKEGDAVLINTPVYPPFARSISLNNRKLINNSLVDVDNQYQIDFEQLEKDIVDNDVKLYILCNPHNPGSRVWTKEELQKIGNLCHKYDVILVSDEIHQDLTLFGHEHHSFNTVNEAFKNFSLILSSATKTFNIAGTKNSFAIIENKELRETFKRQQLKNNQHEIPTIGLITTQVAYESGQEWLNQLKKVLEENSQYVYDYLSTNTKIKVMKPQGTYLLWLDFSVYGLDVSEVDSLLKEKAKVVLNNGITFGKEGKLFFRLNVATPFETVKVACDRIAETFNNLTDK